MRSDPSQYLFLVAFTYKPDETNGSVSETGYRIIACISQFAQILRNPARNHRLNIFDRDWSVEIYAR